MEILFCVYQTYDNGFLYLFPCRVPQLHRIMGYLITVLININNLLISQSSDLSVFFSDGMINSTSPGQGDPERGSD